MDKYYTMKEAHIVWKKYHNIRLSYISFNRIMLSTYRNYMYVKNKTKQSYLVSSLDIPKFIYNQVFLNDF